MKLFNLRVLSLSIVAMAAVSTGCVYDNADRFTTESTVTFNDGVTPISSFFAEIYDAQFWLSNGANVVRSYQQTVQINPSTTGVGILADSSGQFSVLDTDVYLNAAYESVECYDTCVEYESDCYIDEYGDLYCEDYCVLYAEDCYLDTDVYTYDFSSVVATETFLSYNYGGAPVTTRSIETSPATVVDTDEVSSMVRREKFVTPFDVSSASQNGRPVLASQAIASGAKPHQMPSAMIARRDGQAGKTLLTLIGDKAVKNRVTCSNQAALSDAQMAKVRSLREALGVLPSQIVGRQ